MPMTCTCPVCLALAGIPARTPPEDVAAALPLEVRAVLSAQARTRDHRATPADTQLVEAAAVRCSAGRFEPHTEVH